MRQSACLVFNPVTVINYASRFHCTPMGRASDSLMARVKANILVGWGWSVFVCCLTQPGLTGGSFFTSVSSGDL